MDMTGLRPAGRSFGRARRRYLRACGTPMEPGDVLLDDGIIIPEPSDD